MAKELTLGPNEKWFSLRAPKKINGKPYSPSVCYEVTDGLNRVVASLVASGDAVTYPGRVRFVSGVAVRHPSEEEVMAATPAPVYNTPVSKVSVTSKGKGKDKYKEVKQSSKKAKSNKEFS